MLEFNYEAMKDLPVELFEAMYAMMLEEYCKRHGLHVVEEFEKLLNAAKSVVELLGEY